MISVTMWWKFVDKNGNTVVSYAMTGGESFFIPWVAWQARWELTNCSAIEAICDNEIGWYYIKEGQ